MPTIKNVSPWGDLDVPLLGRQVDNGDDVEVTDDQARVLLAQAINFAPADDAAKAILAELEAAEAEADQVDEVEPKPKPSRSRGSNQKGASE